MMCASTPAPLAVIFGTEARRRSSREIRKLMNTSRSGD